MSSTVTLSQDQNTSLPGVNLRWVYANVGTVKEISLVYFKNTSDADISSVDIASGAIRYNIPSGFVSGQAYTYQLQVVDVSDTITYSNALVITAPWLLAPPSLSSVTGLDSALKVQLGATANQLSAGQGHTVEFVLKRDDNVVFWIVKPYVANGQYTLSSADDAQLQNNTSYRVACMYQPSSTSSQYKSPSAISNSITATPSNVPNAPTGVSTASVGTLTRDLAVYWTKPSDFAEWSSGAYTIHLVLSSSLGAIYEHDIVSTDVVQYVWTDLPSAQSYSATVQYINEFGDGEISSPTTYRFPTSVPDAPVQFVASEGDQQSVLTWTGPSYDGQTPISQYKIYKDGAYLATVSAPTNTYTAVGLVNGFSYTFKVSAVNSVGESVQSAPQVVRPYGQMSIVSVVASGKSVTATINPNGRPIQSVVLVALDQDPNNIADSEFVVVIPQQQISQITTSNVTVIRNFSTFTSDVDFYCCIVHNEVNSAFYKSA